MRGFDLSTAGRACVVLGSLGALLAGISLSACGEDDSSTTADAVRSIKMRSFAVPPGSEVFKCQEMKNPFGGERRFVTRITSSMARGSHHLLLFGKRFAVDGPIEDCAGTEFDSPGIYGAQKESEDITMPPGVGIVIEPGVGFRVQSHYLNPSSEYIGVNVEIGFELAPRGTELTPAGLVLISQDEFLIPPRSTEKIRGSCRVRQDINLIMTQAHMHSHGRRMEARVRGEVIYQTDDWAHPTETVFSKPLEIKKGETIDFDCLVENSTGSPLRFGQSAIDNEMCILGALIYPYPKSDSDRPFDPCE